LKEKKIIIVNTFDYFGSGKNLVYLEINKYLMFLDFVIIKAISRAKSEIIRPNCKIAIFFA